MRAQWKPTLAMTAAATVAALALLFANAPEGTFFNVAEYLATAAGSLSLAIPTLVAGAALYAVHRRTWLLWCILAAAVSNTLIQAGFDFYFSHFSASPVIYSATLIIREISIPFTAISAGFLFFSRFKGKFDLLRMASLWALGAAFPVIACTCQHSTNGRV